MDLSTITVADFKTQFFRDFPYLPAYDPTAIYNQGQTTYYNGLFFESKRDGLSGVVPVQGADWNKVTDPAITNIDNYVQDQDITNAFAEAMINLNQGLFASDAQIKLGFLYLTAHYLVNDLRTSMQGVQSVGQQIVTGRTVGSISEQYGIQKQYLEDPVLSFYTNTGYGLKFLSMVLPLLRGNFGVAYGTTLP